jgi:hypothetical protein
MIRTADDLPLELKTDIEKALKEWVNSLPSTEAETVVMCVSGIEYTPAQILDQVRCQTDFGKEFVAGLCALHFSMKDVEPGASVVDLIRTSVGPELMTDQRDADHKYKILSERHPPEKLGEISMTAGAICRVLNARGELSLPVLQELVGCEMRILEWAIGWLARKDKIEISVQRQTVFIRLKEALSRGVSG